MVLNQGVFFSVMGKAAAAMYYISEDIELNSPRPKSMPSITQEELNLVNKHLTQLLKAGSDK